MGDQNSTWTRVTPVFDELLTRDTTGRKWIPKLLQLPNRAKSGNFMVQGEIRDYGWGTAEKKLKPSPILLQWLISCGKRPSGKSLRSSANTIEKRGAILESCPKTIGEALRFLNQPSIPERAWYVLEGPSQPDVYIETDDAIIVIEGKRTENGPTRTTDWMVERDQMLRHLDCALERKNHKSLFGFYIVEGETGAATLTIPKKWELAADETVTESLLCSSLPHRSQSERQIIADSFIGVTTWQHVCDELEIDHNSLPDTADGEYA